MNKILLIIGLIIILSCVVGCDNYTYKGKTFIGTISDIEGGSSNNLLILTLSDGNKLPYTTISGCSNKIRIGQPVYKGTRYAWVEYEPGKFC